MHTVYRESHSCESMLQASNKAQSKSWLMKRLHSVKSFRSLSFGGLARAEDEADELARAANS